MRFSVVLRPLQRAYLPKRPRELLVRPAVRQLLNCGNG